MFQNSTTIVSSQASSSRPCEESFMQLRTLQWQEAASWGGSNKILIIPVLYVVIKVAISKEIDQFKSN
jgi:hypothetical protein